MSGHSYRALVIGVGRGGHGKAGMHSIGYAHADTLVAHPRITLAGASDISADNLNRFGENYAGLHLATDVDAALAEVKPEMVSICTYAGSHRELIQRCVDAGVKAVWCEKPLALTMDEVREMIRITEQAGVKVIVNHFRRYRAGFQKARDLIHAGAVGDVAMVIAGIENWDLMEWGTHWLDMIRFLRADQPVTWVMGQARCSGEKSGYGHMMEEHAIAYFAFPDGSRGLLDGGVALPGVPAVRVVGSGGQIDLSEPGDVTLLNADGIQQFPAPERGVWPETSWRYLLEDFVKWMEGGPESQLSLRNAALSTELYLAAYQSARDGDRIDLPLGAQPAFPLPEIAARQSSRRNK